MKQQLTVVKVGGKIVEEPKSLATLLEGFTQIEGAKLLVHGGGRTATALSTQLGIETQMIEGRRITSKEMLEVVTMVYGGLINKRIVSSLSALGQKALGLTGADINIIRSHRRPITKEGIDYGFVGDIDKVDAEALDLLIKSQIIPVIAPLSLGDSGQLLNTNADTIASETANALSNLYDVTLCYCFEKKGVLMDADNDNSVIPHITPQYYEELKQKNIVSGGMLPKLDNCIAALRAGVSRVIITCAQELGRTGTTITL